MRTLTFLSVSLIVACAPGRTQPGEAPAPSKTVAGPAGDCAGLYALDVRHDAEGEVWFSFTDAKLVRPGQQIGVVRGRDVTTLFFQSPVPPSVWAQPRDGSRVSINDRAGLERYRIRVTLRCDKPSNP
jgi:hypothetical protein